MVRCVLKRRNGFVRTISRKSAEPYIAILEPMNILTYTPRSVDELTPLDINKIYFRLDRKFTNENEEEVAVYYE